MLYDYECLEPQCGKITEVKCSAKETTKTIVCPQCGFIAEKRHFSPPIYYEANFFTLTRNQ